MAPHALAGPHVSAPVFQVRLTAALGGMRHIDIALGHVGDGDAIELVAPHATRRPAKVAGSVVDGTDILVEHEAAPREEAG